MLKRCDFCGRPFEANHGNKKMCSDCEGVVKLNRRGRKLPYKYSAPVDIEAYEEQVRKQNIAAYTDTIIAEGYADRQKAKTLASISKIETTL